MRRCSTGIMDTANAHKHLPDQRVSRGHRFAGSNVAEDYVLSLGAYVGGYVGGSVVQIL